MLLQRVDRTFHLDDSKSLNSFLEELASPQLGEIRGPPIPKPYSLKAALALTINLPYLPIYLPKYSIIF